MFVLATYLYVNNFDLEETSKKSFTP